MLNNIGLSVRPWGAPPVAGFQPDSVLLITILWAWQLSLFLINFIAYLYSQCFHSLTKNCQYLILSKYLWKQCSYGTIISASKFKKKFYQGKHRLLALSAFLFHHESYALYRWKARASLFSFRRDGKNWPLQLQQKYWKVLHVPYSNQISKKERVYESDQCSIFEVRYIASTLVILGEDGLVFLECLASGVISALIRGGKI